MMEGMKFSPDDARQREEMDIKVRELEKHGAIITPELRNVGAYEYEIQFPFSEEEAVVQMTILVKEWQTNSDVVITNIATIPAPKRSHGLGGQVVKYILDWAREQGFNEVRATQVSKTESERFWIENGFVKAEEPNPTKDLLHRFENKI